MSIKGLTDRDPEEALHLGYPKIATLYKGDPKIDPKRPGKDRDTFRIEFRPTYNTPEIRAAWDKLYRPDGKDPVRLDWVFLFGYTPEQVFPTWLEEWTKTVMLHRCDGETQQRHYVKATGKYSDAAVPCACTGKDKPSCQRVGRLNLWLPLLMRETGVKGYLSIATHSINDLVRIDSTVKALFREYGDISEIPLQFGREPDQISTPMNGERATTTKSLLYLRVMPDFVKKEIEGQTSGLSLPTAPKHAALPAPKPAALPTPEPVTQRDVVWTDDTVKRAKLWIGRNFGVDAENLLASFGESFATFETVEAWQNAVKAFLRAQQTPIIARAIEVGTGAFDLVTTLGLMHFTGGASALERLFGDERDDLLNKLDPADWTPGGKYALNTPVWVYWETTADGDRATRLSFRDPAVAGGADEVTEGEIIEEVNRAED